MSNNQHLWIYLICTQPMWQHTVYHRYLTQTLQTPWCRASNSWMFSSAGGAIGVATCGSSEVIRWINGWLDESIQWPLKASRNWCFWALNLKFWKMVFKMLLKFTGMRIAFWYGFLPSRVGTSCLIWRIIHQRSEIDPRKFQLMFPLLRSSTGKWCQLLNPHRELSKLSNSMDK